MTERDERPLFIDPIELSAGDDVDDAPLPVWFSVLALGVLAIAVYYLFAFLDGPRASYRHDFGDGRAAYESSGPTPSPSH